MSQVIGTPVDRVDGRLKVTGGAKYSAEFPLKNLATGVLVQSTISKGRIKNINVDEAEKSPGVVKVITYKNSLSLHQLSGGSNDPGSGKLGERDLLPLQNDRIFYDGQHIAIVVADTFENAEHAATLIKVDYDEEKPVFEIEQAEADKYKPSQSSGREVQSKRGDPVKALQDSEVKIEETYITPVYHHNPMEPHATTAEWNGDQLTIYDSTQSVVGSRSAIAQMLGIQPEKVRLISYFIGGGFGSKGFTWPHSVLAPMAAKIVGRPVKIVLKREHMFSGNGHRARTIQNIGLGAGKNGKLESLNHTTTTETSFVDEFLETAGIASKILYDSPNADISHYLVRLNKATPCPTRAPGEAPGTFAMEMAMDELAYKSGIDPVELRLTNYAENNPHTGQPWSEKSLKECYQKGAEAIGWSARNPQPQSMKEGKYLVGYGMATAIYPANRGAASAKVRLYPDGRATTACATQDIGTGTYTILTQIAAEILGLPVEKIECKLGDSQLPKGPNSGGSQTAASAGPAIRAACLDVKSKIIQLAAADKKSPLYGQIELAVTVENGRMFVQSEPSKGETYAQVLTRNRLTQIEGNASINVSTRETQKEESNPSAKQSQAGSEEGKAQENPAVKADEEVDRKKYAFQSFGAHFVKLRVDPLLGTVHIDKCVAVMDIGKVLNPKTAKNQIMGGMVFGIGMALMEGTVYDPNNGRIVTRDLADYHVPVNADMPQLEVEFLDKPDPVISPIGARGVGEIGVTGITAAIVNAIYHATGKRIRELPVTADKLL